MKSLVIGGTGCIGRALLIRLNDGSLAPNRSRLDLSNPIQELPICQVAYLCAGIKGFKECERDPMAWRVNVDGMLAVGKRLLKRDVFTIYVSTSAVEWSDSAYARQRAMVEIGLQAFGDPAIVRAEKFDDETAPQLATFMIGIAQRRQVGIHHWAAV